MTYSVDFRRKVLEVKKKEGLSFEETSKRFCVGKNTIFLWSKKIDPIQKRNSKARKIDMESLKKDIDQYPDAYHHERAQRLSVSKNGIWWAMKRLNVTYKKNSLSSESRRRKTFFVSSTNL